MSTGQAWRSTMSGPPFRGARDVEATSTKPATSGAGEERIHLDAVAYGPAGFSRSADHAVGALRSMDQDVPMLELQESSPALRRSNGRLRLAVNRQAELSSPGRVLSLVEQYVQEHFAEDLRLAKVGQAVGVSPYYVSHLFRRERGTTFLTYLTGIRMAHGRRFLMDTDLSVEVIAERVGYRAAKRFRELFKRTCGITPSEYRRQASARADRTVAR